MDAGDYVTLMGVFVALAALVVSGLALSAAKAQAKIAVTAFDDAQTKERERREARQRAMRIALIPVAHQSADWAKAVAKALVHVSTRATLSRQSLDMPSYPPEFTQTIIQVIEAGENEAVSTRLAKLLSNTQVLTARVRGLEETRVNSIHETERGEFLANAAVIHEQALSVLLWADRREETVPAKISWAHVRGNLRQVGILGTHAEAAEAAIALRNQDRNAEDF